MTEHMLDVICLGRGAVDLYGEQLGGRLEDMQSLAKYVGGSSLNIAVGVARQGLKSSMLLRVGDEHMGRFVRETLAAEGVDTSHVLTDPDRLTALAILGVRDRETFPLIFYRENCADMALAESDFDANYIASAKALLITGTHFSTPHVDRVSRHAIDLARQAGTRVIVDVDYRPVLWGLTGHGAGEERFVADQTVTQHLQSIVPLCDLIVGTEEEMHIAGGHTDTMEAVRTLRRLTNAVLVVKRGALGCSVFPDSIPATLDDGIAVPGVQVDVLNVVGAGDAFMSGFLRGWLSGETFENCCRYANACGALVVSRHGCAPAMPTRAELDDYLRRADTVPHPDLDPHLNRLHRVTTRRGQWSEVCALAFDHRRQLLEMTEQAGADPRRIPRFKQLVAEAFLGEAQALGLQGSAGVLVDDRFGRDTLDQLTGRGLWIARPVEEPGVAPLRFEAGDNIGLRLRQWPREHVVKCLVPYTSHFDPAQRPLQERRVRQLYEACALTGHELLLELVPRQTPGALGEEAADLMAHYYSIGVHPDWWKLPPPDEPAWERISAMLDEHDPYCRGVLLLGMEADEAALRQGFEAARGRRWCKGFAVGRSIFADSARDWLAGEIDDRDAISRVARRYRRIVELWRDARTA